MSHIITLGWHLGSGKSTLCPVIAKHFHLKRYSTGDFMRNMALERGISLLELWTEAENDGGVIDAILDERQKQLGITDDYFIIDWRLPFYFIPHSLKIFLGVDPKEAAKRIFEDKKRKWVEFNNNLVDTTNNIRIRRESEDERYMKYYGIHIYDMELYDIVIDTTELSPEQVADRVIAEIEKRWNV